MVRVENADYLDGRDVPYLVFEYLDGKDVSDLVKDRALGPADTVRLGIDVATGLAFLHANGVYHCDIKPSNLLWTDQRLQDHRLQRGRAVVVQHVPGRRLAAGTRRPTAAAPRRRPRTDLADRDVYALGVTLYQVLTGRYPFASGAPALGEIAADPRIDRRAAASCRTRSWTRCCAPSRRCAVTGTAAPRSSSPRCRRSARCTAGLRPPLPPLPLPVPAAPNVNPFVAHLQSLYSQSPVSNAGTRGADAYGTYVATALDEHLIPDVLDGRYRLVIITGNAGDGKTAFLERLVAEAAERGGQPGEPRANGTDLRLPDGRWLRTNNDGSQDEGDRANDDVLLEFFAPFADGAAADATRDPADRDQRRAPRRLPHRARRPVRGARAHWSARAWRASRPAATSPW